MAASIKQIIDQLETIADAFTGVNTFQFDSVSSINTDPAKTYPVIAVNSVFTSTNVDTFGKNFLPKDKTYPLEIVIWDTYLISEKAGTDLQTKYSKLEILMDQYIAEILRRTLDDPANLSFYLQNSENLVYTYVQNTHTDKLAGVMINAIFRVDNVACNLGTFNY